MLASHALAAASRVGLRGPAVVAGALALTLVSPLALLLVTPLVLGVPHVVGDLRCLLLSPQARERRARLLAPLAPLAAMTMLGAAPLLGLGSWPRAQIACGAAAVLAGVFSAGGKTRARTWIASAVVALALAACANPAASLVFLAHAHNLIAFAWFYAWTRDRREARAALWVYVAACAVIFAGAVDLQLDDVLGGLSAARLATQLAPGASEELAQRLVSSFAFAQAVHYGVWIWLLPRERATTLRKDLGVRGLWLFAIIALLVPLIALRDPAGARDAYLSFAVFHGWLELAVLAFLLTRRVSA